MVGGQWWHLLARLTSGARHKETRPEEGTSGRASSAFPPDAGLQRKFKVRIGSSLPGRREPIFYALSGISESFSPILTVPAYAAWIAERSFLGFRRVLPGDTCLGAARHHKGLVSARHRSDKWRDAAQRHATVFSFTFLSVDLQVPLAISLGHEVFRRDAENIAQGAGYRFGTAI